MKKLRQFSMAVVITLMLSLSAFAGIMETPAPLPNPSGTASSSMSTTGIMETPRDQQDSASTNPIVDVALSLLQSVLSVF